MPPLSVVCLLMLHNGAPEQALEQAPELEQVQEQAPKLVQAPELEQALEQAPKLVQALELEQALEQAPKLVQAPELEQALEQAPKLEQVQEQAPEACCREESVFRHSRERAARSVDFEHPRSNPGDTQT